MAFREIRRDPNENLFEPEGMQPTRFAPMVQPKIKFKLPTLDLDNKENLKNFLSLSIKCIAALALIWFGLTASGSYTGPVSGRFAGDLARVFYQWQLGTFVAMIGAIIGYDTIRNYI